MNKNNSIVNIYQSRRYYNIYTRGLMTRYLLTGCFVSRISFWPNSPCYMLQYIVTVFFTILGSIYHRFKMYIIYLCYFYLRCYLYYEIKNFLDCKRTPSHEGFPNRMFNNTSPPSTQIIKRPQRYCLIMVDPPNFVVFN